MATKLTLFLWICAIWTADFTYGASSQNAPAPAVDCSSLVLTMADCLSFVSNGSTITKPEGNCCSGLKTVLKADPACLCEAFKSSAQFGVILNVTKAGSLPDACKVYVSSANNCGLSQTPVAAPDESLPPQFSSPTSDAAGTPSLSANEESPAPAPSPGISGSSLFPISAGSVLVCLLAAMFSGF